MMAADLATALIKGKFFAQEQGTCPREWIELPEAGWTDAEVAQVNVKLLTKLRLAVVLFTDKGGIVALLYRETKQDDEWDYAMVSDSSYLLLDKSGSFKTRSHKTQVPKVHAADSEKVEQMETQLARLGFPLDRNNVHGTFTGLKGLYPSSYDQARVSCDFVQCVAIAFMHSDYEYDEISSKLHSMVRTLAFDFFAVTVEVAKQLARERAQK